MVSGVGAATQNYRMIIGKWCNTLQHCIAPQDKTPATYLAKIKDTWTLSRITGAVKSFCATEMRCIFRKMFAA